VNPSTPPTAFPPYGIFSMGGTVTVGPITTTFSDGTTQTSEPENVGSFPGSEVIVPDSVLEFEVTADSDLNTHPVEEGGFQAFNRVQAPRSIRMLMACQGRNMPRGTFLSTLEDLREGTEVVTISSPDDSYPNMVLKSFGYKKTSERGAVTIYADTMWVEERSTNVSVSAPPTAQPQGAATTNLGALQPITVTAQKMATVNMMAIINNPPVPPAPLPASYANTAPPSGAAG
jgi:hypothetical protein